ncbi:MAG: hypothetical protein VB914_00015, partial [Porticoccaceae bacterium]
LRLLFGTAIYRDKDYAHDWQYWLPLLGLMQDLLKCDDDGEYEDIPEKIGEHWIYGVEDDCLLTDEFIIDEEAPSILLEAVNIFNEATVTKWLEDNEWSVDSVTEIKREFEEYQKR